MSKTYSILDNNKNTILYNILEKLKGIDKDAEAQIKEKAQPIYSCTKLKIDEIKREIEKKQSEFNSKKKMFEEVQKLDTDIEDTTFATNIKSFFEEKKEDLDKTQAKCEEVFNEFTKICDYFMVTDSV